MTSVCSVITGRRPRSAPAPLGKGEIPYSTRPGRTQSARLSGQASRAAEFAMLRAPASPAVADANDCICWAVFESRRSSAFARWVTSVGSGATLAMRRNRSYASANCSSRKPRRFMPVSTLIHAEITSLPARPSSISSCSKLCTIRSKRCCAAAFSWAVLNTPSSSRMRLVRPAARNARPSSSRATANPSVCASAFAAGTMPWP